MIQRILFFIASFALLSIASAQQPEIIPLNILFAVYNCDTPSYCAAQGSEEKVEFKLVQSGKLGEITFYSASWSKVINKDGKSFQATVTAEKETSVDDGKSDFSLSCKILDLVTGKITESSTNFDTNTPLTAIFNFSLSGETFQVGSAVMKPELTIRQVK